MIKPIEPNIMDVNRAFERYLHEQEVFSIPLERFAIDVEQGNHAILKGWLKAAFEEGFRTAAKDSVATLLSFRTSMSGCGGDALNSTQAFDIAAENLAQYFEQVLEATRKGE